MAYNPSASPYLPEAVPHMHHSNLPEPYHYQNQTAYPVPQSPPPGVPAPSHPPRYSELSAGHPSAIPATPAPEPKTAGVYAEEHPLPPRQPWWRRHLLLLCIAAIIVVGAAVGGGVGGALAAEKKKSNVVAQQDGDGVAATYVYHSFSEDYVGAAGTTWLMSWFVQRRRLTGRVNGWLGCIRPRKLYQ
jgi:hypothetical protein